MLSRNLQNNRDEFCGLWKDGAGEGCMWLRRVRSKELDQQDILSQKGVMKDKKIHS